ncbi:hypothetical protein MNBD_CHLOROFLEXI01-5349 [hydrothermal vent metagenome]|uniref:DUF5666 domain-containing protein n=1 Tax=hydrothermal vent metagenome TaxID=652676 RepID=A0A3B0VRW3_9ZZZZ
MNQDGRSISICLKKAAFLLGLAGLVAACSLSGGLGGETAVPIPTPMFDEETGLQLNPVLVPSGEFVVRGRITAVNLTPQDAPLIKVVSENGQTYQILAQPVAQITTVDGTAVAPLDIKNGRLIRATVWQNETGGLGGEPVLVSSNLTILVSENE